MAVEQPHASEPQKPPQEIERKFLLSVLPPEIVAIPGKQIRQGYLEINPDGSEIRVRQKGDEFTRTAKSGKGKTRTEDERLITKAAFDIDWPNTEGRRIEKVRRKIPYETPQGTVTIEVDDYEGNLKGLRIAEVEFPDDEKSNQFQKPTWFGQEVTEDARYKNQSLALHGVPSHEPTRFV